MSYKELDVWSRAREITISVHHLSLQLPKFEQFEPGSQIRRSSKSVRTNIVEGYGRRFYKQDFIRFIIYAIALNDETLDHLETLAEVGSIPEDETYLNLHNSIVSLGRKLNNFLEAVQKNHISPK